MTLYQLYDLIYNDESTKAPERFISIFDSYISTCQDSEVLTDVDSLYKDSVLHSDYAHNLTITESYKEAIPAIELAIRKMELWSTANNADYKKFDFYEILIFDRVISNYYLGHFSKAKKDIKYLITRNPEKQIYKTWKLAILLYWMQPYLNILWYTAAGFTIIMWISNITDSIILNDIVYDIGAILLITVVSMEVLKLMIRKKLNKNKNDLFHSV